MWGGLLLQDLERSISLPPFFSHKQAYGSGSEVSTLPLMSGSLDHQAEARPWRGRLRKCSSICSWSGFWMHWVRRGQLERSCQTQRRESQRHGKSMWGVSIRATALLLLLCLSSLWKRKLGGRGRGLCRECSFCYSAYLHLLLASWSSSTGIP